MEDGVPTLGGSLERALSDAAIDSDLMDDLLSGGYWRETPDSFRFSPFLEISDGCLNPISPRIDNPDDKERPDFSANPPSDEIQPENLDGKDCGIPKYSIQSGELESVSSRSEPGTNYSIQPRRGLIVSMEERLRLALDYIKDSQGYGDALVQIWLPIKRGGRQVLTTYGLPFSLNPNCQSLVHYRSVSTSYQFSAEENSDEAPGLPGRVFLGMVPEWTPDVRYFSSNEYLRVHHAHCYNVHGTIAVPIFERESKSCLGVVEVVATVQKISYSSDLENICNALQAVNLRSTEVSAPHIKVSNGSYQAALPEIREVLRTVCNLHKLPLAQTWIPCIQQGKKGCRHSDDNYNECVSTVDSACYVNDPSVLEFHEACSEHHLFRGQGVAGKAFTTNQPCFSSDITALSKIEYPLSHHAKFFHLGAAVAIRLRSIHTGIADFVLEFFLPVDCRGSEEQKLMLNSLSITLQQACENLRVVTAEELEDEAVLQDNEVIPSITLPLEFNRHESEGFTEFKQYCQDSVEGTTDHKDTFPCEPSFSNVGKAKEKQRAKTEKTISLEILRQYFAGSLKDAAKSIGVCPTTLKRICRQHGITRWPSRKIKKVGHSLKKLQVVIDSVQGAEGTFHFSSLYENFRKASAPDKDHPESSTAHQQQEPRLISCTPAPNCVSSSSCSRSSDSSLACSSETKQCSRAPQLVDKQEASNEGNQSGDRLKGSLNQEEPPRSPRSTMFLDKHLSSRSLSPTHKKRDGVLKVKAMYGEEKVRFRLQPTWGFEGLKQEIGSRFNISNIDSVVLKYLDDDAEWVLLTCDADLRECIHVYQSSHLYTIKISARIAQPIIRASIF